MLDYIRSLLSLIFGISLMYILLDCEVKQKKHLYLLGIYATIVLISDGLFLQNFGYAKFMKLYPLLVHIPVLLAFLFFSNFKVIKVFFVQFTVIAITTSLSLIGLIISCFFGFDRVIVNVVCYIMYIPTWFVVYKYLRPSFLYMLRNTDKGWLGFCVIPISYSALLYFTSKYNLDTVVSDRVFMFAGLVFILTLASYFLILKFFKQTREQLTLQNEHNLLQMQVTAAQVHFEALQDSQEKTIIYRHDMRHHLHLINAYLADNKTAIAQKYIREVEKTIEDATFEKYCSNYAVNLILSSYIAKARNEQITVVSQIDLREENAVSDMELCVILANGIENAVHACLLIPDVDDRTIKIVCKNKNDKLFIQITNSYAGTVSFIADMPVSTKENHGLGTKSIAAVVQKYGGLYSFTAENGVFKTSIIL